MKLRFDQDISISWVAVLTNTRTVRLDAGLTPAQLGWVLGQMRLGEDAGTTVDVSVEELRQYLADLISRLGRLAFPGDSS